MLYAVTELINYWVCTAEFSNSGGICFPVAERPRREITAGERLSCVISGGGDGSIGRSDTIELFALLWRIIDSRRC